MGSIDPMNLIGKTLKKYQILDRIGGGGMGEVYKAHDSDPMLDRDVAIKVLSPFLVRDANFVYRFQLEARTVARLKHPNIVPVYDAGREADLVYIVMELLEGGSLKDLINREGPLSPERVIELLGQVASGLDYAHSNDLIHRDIKPGNILLNAQGQVKVTDFGLVKDISQTMMTGTGEILGTPPYMAPEQILSQDVTPQTDIYALGVVAYQMLTGERPFKGPDTLYAHLHEAPPTLRKANPSVPMGLEPVVAKALAKTPTERYPSATAFVQALREGLDPPPTGRLAWAVGAAAVLVLLCICGLCVIISIPPPTSTPTITSQTPTEQTRQAATATAVDERMRGYEANRNLVYGPTAGSLVHDNDDKIEVRFADVELRDFWVEATFFNPYSAQSGDWDYGFLFRREALDQEFRLIIKSNETLKFTNGPHQEIDEGLIPNLNVGTDESNHVRLIADGNKAYLYINGQFIDQLDLSERTNAGGISVGTGMFEGDQMVGQTTLYQEFTIWSISE